MNECIFCKIANGDPANLVWSSKNIAAFKDLYPTAPVHLLVVPKRHITNLDELEDGQLAGELLLAAREVAHAAGLRGAWRARINNGEKAGQSVHHLHLHVTGRTDGAHLDGPAH